MKKLIWRDAAGTIIHIGEWDYQPQQVATNPLPADAVNRPVKQQVMTEPTFEGHGKNRKMVKPPEPMVKDGEPVMQPAGDRWYIGNKLICEGPWDYAYQTIDTNPVPEGATGRKEEVIEADDGAKVVASDHVTLRRGAYPPITDQLDALWKGGTEADAMRSAILAVKQRFPKPKARQLKP